ncbi:M48 family metallopeptidase [Streptomyces melanogenes]|uniref:M48 family metallopeptidase n=1 Tax=Streptomyces melanogenes TaxID=67326 RepID=UPI003795C390
MQEQITAGVGGVAPCPQCGADIPAGERFVRWCTVCDWNVDPEAAAPTPGRLAALQRRLAHRHGEQLHAELLTDPAARPRRDRAAGFAFAVALAVHGLTLALALCGLLLVVLGWSTVSQPLLGAVLLVLAYGLRPRFARLPKGRPVLRRSDAPRLFGLVDQVAQAVGTTGVDTVAVTADFNASVAAVGIRGRRHLEIGLALWEVLDWQERIALLGHELGHYAHGDTRHGRVLGSALRSLTLWRFFLAPHGFGLRRRSLQELFIDALLALPRWLVYAVSALLERLTLRAAQRAEYLADRAAARAGSSEAATALLDRMLIAESVITTLRTQSVIAHTRSGTADRRTAAEGLWERIAERAATVPEREYERLRRVSARRGHSVDDTHPPTHLRRSLIQFTGSSPAAVVVPPDLATAVTAELAQRRAAVAREAIRDLAG